MDRCQSIWYSAIGWGGMIGALMAAGISKMNDEANLIPRWQIIFYILGSITIIWGAVLYFFLEDGPSSARWIPKDQRPLAVARVANNGTGIKSKKFDKKQAIEALVDPKAWLITVSSLAAPLCLCLSTEPTAWVSFKLAMFGSSIPNGVLSNFSGPIIKGMGFSELNAALLDCAGRSLQVISLLIAGMIATKFENCRIIMATVGNIIWWVMPASPFLSENEEEKPNNPGSYLSLAFLDPVSWPSSPST